MVPDLEFDEAPSPSESDDEAPATGQKRRGDGYLFCTIQAISSTAENANNKDRSATDTRKMFCCFQMC